MKIKLSSALIAVLLGLFVFAILPAAAVAAGSPAKKVYEIDAGSKEGVQVLADAGFDIWDVKGTVVTVALNDGELAEASSMAFSPKLKVSDIDALLKSIQAPPGTAAVDYHTYASLVSDLHALEASGIARTYVIGQSIEGRDIVAVKIARNPSVEDPTKPEILFVGNHHAREWISVEVPYYLAKYLVDNYAGDPQIKSFVDNGQIWIVPMVNPDGLEYSRLTDRMWRKNRRNNGGGVYGVDLNRNYASGFGGPGSSSIPSSDVYHGTVAFSEPETAAVRDLVLAHHFKALMTWHSYSQLVLWPIGYSYSVTPDDKFLGRMANLMAKKIKDVNAKYYTPEKSSDLYLASGTTDDWFYENQDYPGFTIELRPTGAIPGFALPATEITPTFEENLPVALYLIGKTQSDGDGDGVADIKDNCPTVANPDQADANTDGIGDACVNADRDGDGVVDSLDNCPETSNADQKDSDNDGFGDACEPDQSGGGTCGGLPGGADAFRGSSTAALLLLALPAMAAAILSIRKR